MKKTISFGILHMMVAFTVGYAFTGSWMVGGLMAIVEPIINTVVFYFHEKVWNKIDHESTSSFTFHHH